MLSFFGAYNTDTVIGSPPLTSPLSPVSGLTSPKSKTPPEENQTTSSKKSHNYPPSRDQMRKESTSSFAEATGSGAGEDFAKSPPNSTVSQPQTYPAVLMKSRPGSSSSNPSRVKVPPPVPPRTPKRVGTEAQASAAPKGRIFTRTPLSISMHFPRP